jgi:hypothetical protein
MLERLKNLEVALYTLGKGAPEVQAEMTILCDLGYDTEVLCMVHEFETAVFNGELEDF